MYIYIKQYVKKDLAKINWDAEFQNFKYVNEMTTKFEEIIDSKIKELIPLKKQAKDRQQTQAPWINLASLNAIRRKYHAWKSFKI